MTKVPKLISTKDLSYISDMFSWHNTLANKLTYYLETCDDKEVATAFQKLQKIHTKNCKCFIKILEGGDSSDC